MKTIRVFLLLASTTAVLSAQNHPPLDVAPLFTNVGTGPAFMLTCVNDAAAPIRVIDIGEKISVRVDGTPVPSPGVFGSGGDRTVPPGGSVKVMFVLQQGPPSFSKSPDLGAALRILRPAPLTAGLHSVQFDCLGRTSNALPMYWENATISK